MRKLEPLTLVEHDDETFHRDLFARKYQPTRSLLEELIPEMLRRFTEYRGLLPSIEKLGPTSGTISAQKAHLHGIFEQKSALISLTSQLFSRSSNVCPMCGHLTAPLTVDHVAPKELFPEFSIFALNLVPCCTDCNSNKGMAFANLLNGQRLIVHPYVDEFLNATFLTAGITAPFEAPRFSLHISRTALTKTQADLCQSHIDALKLTLRFDSFCLGRYFELWRNLYQPYGRTTYTAQEIAALVKSRLPGSVSTYGPNNWEAAFYRAIQRSTAVRKFLAQTAPPKDDDALRARMQAAYVHRQNLRNWRRRTRRMH